MIERLATHLMLRPEDVSPSHPDWEVIGVFNPGAIRANERAIAADDRYIDCCKPSGIYPLMYYNHNVHFLAVAACDRSLNLPPEGVCLAVFAEPAAIHP